MRAAPRQPPKTGRSSHSLHSGSSICALSPYRRVRALASAAFAAGTLLAWRVADIERSATVEPPDGAARAPDAYHGADADVERRNDRRPAARRGEAAMSGDAALVSLSPRDY